MSQTRLLDRFLAYVKIESQADFRATTYPSSPGQIQVGELLLRELLEMGLDEAYQDKNGLVYALIPGNPSAAAIALVAHVDTSPESPGGGVVPQIVSRYDGKDILLEGSKKVLSPSRYPELSAYLGKTLITTDGTTLLGADDKAGVAVIMEAAQRLLEDPLNHGPIMLLFTCDEEIGHGVDHVDIEQLGVACAYTLDGGPSGELDIATFSADKAEVTLTGINIHPSIGKGKMVNAVRLAGIFLDRLPKQLLSPETTEGMEGFIHPYEIQGGVAQTKISMLLRDFQTAALDQQEALLQKLAREIETEYAGAKVEVTRQVQYRNMAEGLTLEPRAVALAEQAMKNAGIVPKLTSVRGGTDGSRLTERGLPTPNIFCGEHNAHSLDEWCCLEEMEESVKTVIELVKLWAKERA